MRNLCINIDHIATLRQARATYEPDPVNAAGICERAGADGIVVHLREDRRHIQDRDLRLLREVITTKLDLEMGATEAIKAIALEVKPEMVTLVPEKRQELTTEGGLNVLDPSQAFLADFIKSFQDHGIEVSLFIDPDLEQIEKASQLKANYVEIHTGEFANAKMESDAWFIQIDRIAKAAKAGADLGLKVNAGHGLTYHNIHPIAAIPEIGEMSIGHAIISRAVFDGLEKAVRDMVALVKTGVHG